MKNHANNSKHEENLSSVASAKLSDALEKSTKLSRALEFQTFLQEVERLIAGAATMTGEELAQAKVKLNERIESLKDTFNEVSEDLTQIARRGATITNNYVHEQPWTAIGASAFFGLVVGCLLARRN